MAEPILRRGDRGEWVTYLQQLLEWVGLYPWRVDGVFGWGTDSAVRAYQRSCGLNPDGVVGPWTWFAVQPMAVDVLWPDVVLRAQSKPDNCANTAAAMVAEWDRRASFGDIDAMANFGTIDEVAAHFDLELEPLVSITPATMHQMLTTSADALGPISIARMV